MRCVLLRSLRCAALCAVVLCCVVLCCAAQCFRCSASPDSAGLFACHTPSAGVGRETLDTYMVLLVRESGLWLLEKTEGRDAQNQEEAVSAGLDAGQGCCERAAGTSSTARPAAPHPSPLSLPCPQLQFVLGFLGTSKILPGRSFIKALSLEVAAVAYLHCSGPAAVKVSATHPHCAMLPRLLTDKRLDAARATMLRHGEHATPAWRRPPRLCCHNGRPPPPVAALNILYTPNPAGDTAKLQQQLMRELVERRRAVQQGVLDEVRELLEAAVAKQQADGRPLQLPAGVAVAALVPSARQMDWDGRGALPRPPQLVFAILLLACGVPLTDARQLSGCIEAYWASLGSRSTQQLLQHLQQYGALSPAEAKLASSVAKFEQLSADARVLLEEAVKRGAPAEVLEVHDRAIPPDAYLQAYTGGSGRDLSATSLAGAELFLMGVDTGQVQQLVPGSPAPCLITRAACSLTWYLAFGDTSAAAAALRAEAEVDGTAGAADLPPEGQGYWKRNVMRLHELACRRLPALVDSGRLSQEEARQLVRCLARVAIPPGWKPMYTTVFISTYLAGALRFCFPGRISTPEAMLAAGRPSNARIRLGAHSFSMQPFLQHLAADFAAVRETAAAAAAEAAAAEAAAEEAEAEQAPVQPTGAGDAAGSGVQSPAAAASTSAAAAAAAESAPPAPSAAAAEAILLAAAGRVACARAGVTGGPLGLSAAAAAGRPTASQLAARHWYLVDVLTQLCDALAKLVHAGRLTLADAQAQAERAAGLLPPDSWQKPRANFKVRPTGVACVLYALDPSIGVEDAMGAAGAPGQLSFAHHLKEGAARGGTLAWMAAQLGTQFPSRGGSSHRQR